jgi:DNA invertase Pin-like site-specific DNA recombinase
MSNKTDFERRDFMYREMPTFQPDEVLEYMRKSRSDDPTLTIEEVLANHNTKLNEWIERNLPAPIPEVNVYREVVSGETIQSRPKFKELLKRIESPKIKAVLVLECERLGRPDLEEIGKISKLFRYTNTIVITPQRIFDLRDEWDREQFEREMMRGKDYLDYTKKVLTRGKEISLQSGFFINGVYPYGYTREWVMDGKRERPTLAIVENEAKVVRMIFDWYANEGIGTMKISQRLNSMGIPARKGGQWKKSTISRMLKNEHYIGKIVIKKHIDVNVVEDSTITTHCMLNPDFEIVDGKHPAIIDEDLFYRANNKISRHISYRPNTTLQNPFASILKCECGRAMRRAKDRHKFRYLCDEQTFCGNASIQENELIPAVIQALKDNLDNLSTQVTNEKDNKKEKHTEYVSLLESRYVEIEKKELALWDKYSEEKMPKQVFDKLMAKCMEEKQNLENALETAYNDVPTHKDYKGAIAILHDAIEMLGDDSVSASTKNKLLLSIVDKIVYRREKPIRMTAEESKAKGLKTKNGWYMPDFELDVYLKL